ncbi:hypothetical protein [Ideonella livida]|uniref:Uncharacterized protein n=1 Tax=Ideonella livida TaxID=2707176 RepID=A0A7C9PIT7_9BURK|nr:hypothetical protein [Ideonella livida]NDY92214.1 hypothetical protein [Ideonella livida]
MHVVPIAWMFVVVLMTAAEATSPQGTLLGALITFLFYGLLPLAVVMYILGTPARRRARARAARAEQAAATPTAPSPSGAPPDGRGLPPGDTIAPERKEP